MHVPRPEARPLRAAVPRIAVGPPGVRADLVLQRLGSGGPEGDGAAPQKPAGAALQL